MTLTREFDQPRPAAAGRAGLSVEAGLYLAIFALALWLRLAGLGAAPLNDPEAREALTVLRFLRGGAAAGLPASPAYFTFTALAFLIWPAGDALARLAPALASAGLALLPWFFRRELGRGTALAAGALLAVSTTLTAAGRTADGTSLTLFAFGLALGLLNFYRTSGAARWLLGAAVVLGAALAGGREALTGVVILGLLGLAVARSSLAEAADGGWRAGLAAERWGVLAALALSLVLVATFGLTYRSGLAALGTSWLSWFTGFAPGAGGRSLLAVPVFLTTYEPLLLVFGVWGAWRAFRRGDPVGQLLAGAAFLGLLVVLFTSGRSLPQAAWCVVPLAVLAAQALTDGAALADAGREEWAQALTLAGLLLALLIFAGLNLARFVDQTGLSLTTWPPALNQAPGFWLAVLTVVVGGLVTFLFSATWSRAAAGLGLRGAGVGALLALTLSAGWGLTQLRADEPTELWWPHPAAGDVRRLAATLADISNFNVGQEHEIVVTAQASPDGALAWALRDFTKVTFTDSLDASINSPVVIAPAGEQNPALGSAYVGQGFTAYRRWRPENLFTSEQVNWLLTRRAPVEAEKVVLWVRQDVQQPRSPQTP